MIDHTTAILDSFRRACRPPARLAPSAWASGRVALFDGLSPKYDVANAPWQREPLDILADPDAREIVLLAPIGTGKTTFLEASLAYIITEDPGSTLLVGQTDEDLKDWAETRMDYIIRQTPEVAALLPSDRHKARKMEILFPHMSLFLTGANLSGLQSKSMRRVFCDEAWQYKPAMIQEARGRLHDRWNRQIFLMSQAGVQGDDLDKAWEMTNKKQFMFQCPRCDTVQEWRQANLVLPEDGELVERSRQAYCRCENTDCDFRIEDNAQQRRQLAMSAQYIATNHNCMPGHVGFHYNVLCNWRKPLWEIARDWLIAKESVRLGNIDPLRQYIQKRLAEPWVEDLTDQRKELIGGGFRMEDFTQGQKIDEEATRFLLVDKQRDHFWSTVEAWRNDGSARLLYFGRLETWAQLEEIQTRYGVQPRLCFVDCGYMPDEVYDNCGRRDWTALRGSKLDSFPGKTKQGKKVRRPYSEFGYATTASGAKCRFAYWSSDRIKDICYAIRTGKGPAFEIGEDVPSEYLAQLDSEVKKEITNPTTKQVEHRWTKKRRDNHAWDLRAEAVVAALMIGLMPGFHDGEE
jgi:hypothetical protein